MFSAEKDAKSSINQQDSSSRPDTFPPWSCRKQNAAYSSSLSEKCHHQSVHCRSTRLTASGRLTQKSNRNYYQRKKGTRATDNKNKKPAKTGIFVEQGVFATAITEKTGQRRAPPPEYSKAIWPLRHKLPQASNRQIHSINENIHSSDKTFHLKKNNTAQYAGSSCVEQIKMRRARTYPSSIVPRKGINRNTIPGTK